MKQTVLCGGVCDGQPAVSLTVMNASAVEAVSEEAGERLVEPFRSHLTVQVDGQGAVPALEVNQGESQPVLWMCALCFSPQEEEEEEEVVVVVVVDHRWSLRQIVR